MRAHVAIPYSVGAFNFVAYDLGVGNGCPCYFAIVGGVGGASRSIALGTASYVAFGFYIVQVIVSLVLDRHLRFAKDRKTPRSAGAEDMNNERKSASRFEFIKYKCTFYPRRARSCPQSSSRVKG